MGFRQFLHAAGPGLSGATRNDRAVCGRLLPESERRMASVTPSDRPHVIVLGNEKGGSGKSTTAIYIIVALLRAGYRVGAMDLDARQGTLAGTLAARRHFVETKQVTLPLPEFRAVHRSALDNRLESAAE